MTCSVQVGSGPEARRVAYEARAGHSPTVVWFGGFRSDMRATKAEALDAWAAGSGRSFLRFDYSGHGESGGTFAEGTISRWLDDAVAVLAAAADGPTILVGSSMGAWLALLATLRLRAEAPERAPRGLVLIAPATDFTERLMWDTMASDVRHTIETEGVYMRASLYAPEGYPITRALIEDGRRHLLLDGPIATGCPVHILQGMQDPDVPWEHALRLVERLPGDDVQLMLIKDGDHRLSRPEDLDRLVRAVEALCGRVADEAAVSSG